MAKIALLGVGLFILILGAALIGIGSERCHGRPLTIKEANEVMFELFLCAVGLTATIVGAYQ